MNTKEPLFGGAPSFCESRNTLFRYPRTVASLMAVEGRDSHLAPLRVAYFEHGAWLPRHVCIERAKQQEVKSESIRADFNRFVSRRILPIYAAWSIPRPLLVKVAREGDYRIGYERYFAGPGGIPFEAFVHELLARYRWDPTTRLLVRSSLTAIRCASGEAQDKERLLRNILRGAR